MMPPTSSLPPLSATPVAVANTKTAVGKRPKWQRNPAFRLFSSVRLAIVLLSVVIIASAVGTVYESNFDANVARAYVYQAAWFNLWLLALGLNLTCSALSRWPWQRHHTGFLLTHLGIIVLMVGAVIGRSYGIEGTMTIFKGQPPNNQLVINEHVLGVEENGRFLNPFPVSVIGRRPTAAKPWTLGVTPAGWKVELTDYSERLKVNFEPQAIPAAALSSGAAGQPAVRLRLVSKRLNQNMENWLLAGDSEHGGIDMGIASVQLRRGVAPVGSVAVATAFTASPAPNPPTAAPAVPASRDAETGFPNSAPKLAAAADGLDERIFSFALKPDEQITAPATGDKVSSGIKVRLDKDPAKRAISVEWRGATWDFNLDADRGKPQDLSGSGVSVTIEDYWNDFVMQNGQPVNASTEPRNPAVLVHVTGKLPPAGDTDPVAAATATGGHVDTNTTTDANIPRAANEAILYCDDAGALTFTLRTSASPQPITGKLLPGQPINTGWADWQLQADQVIPQAVPQTTFQNVNAHSAGDSAATAANAAGGNEVEGVRVRLSRRGVSHEEWIASGWNLSMPTGDQPTHVTYGFRVDPLPVGFELTDFEVERQEGNDNPAAFKSSLRATDGEGNTGTGSCSMNQPFNFPGHWWNTFTGLTYKVSQAQWNPDNLAQSSIQILRDPGWTFKWMGSLLICTGIFTLFYLRPSPRNKPPVEIKKPA